jgi:hypothetical protein
MNRVEIETRLLEPEHRLPSTSAKPSGSSCGAIWRPAAARELARIQHQFTTNGE